MITIKPFENFPNKPTRFGFWADFLNAGGGTMFTSTLANTGTATILDTEVGGVIRLSGAATTDDSGVNYQATNSPFGFVLGKETLFLARVRFGESTSANMPAQCDFAAGLAVMDTTILASAPTAGVYFRKDDGDALLDCIVRAGSAEVGLSLGAITVEKDVWYELAIRISPDPTTSGKGTVTFYVDGTQKASISLSSLSTSPMAPFVAFLSGDNTGTKYADVDYIGTEQAR